MIARFVSQEDSITDLYLVGKLRSGINELNSTESDVFVVTNRGTATETLPLEMELEATGLGDGDTVMVEVELKIHRGVINERPYLVQTPIKLSTLPPGVGTQAKLEIPYNFFRLEVPFTVIRRQSLTNQPEATGGAGY